MPDKGLKSSAKKASSCRKVGTQSGVTDPLASDHTSVHRSVDPLWIVNGKMACSESFPSAGIQELLKGLSKFPSDSNRGKGVFIQAEFAPSSLRSALLEQVKYNHDWVGMHSV